MSREYEVRIFINYDERRNIAISGDATVADLKKIIQDHYGVPTVNQVILIDGLLFPEDSNMTHALIEDLPAVNVFTEHEVYEIEMFYKEHTLTGKYPALATVDLISRGFSLYLMCEIGSSFNPKSVEVLFRDQQTKPGVSLRSLGVHDGDSFEFSSGPYEADPTWNLYAQERKRFCLQRNELMQLTEDNHVLRTRLADIQRRDSDPAFALEKRALDEKISLLEEENSRMRLAIGSGTAVGNDVSTQMRINELENELRRHIDLKEANDKALLEAKNSQLKLLRDVANLKCTMLEMKREKESYLGRIENLNTECTDLSQKLNDAMEMEQKYRIGYENLKKRTETDRAKIISDREQLDQDIRASGLHYIGRVITPTDQLTASDLMVQLREEILAHHQDTIQILDLRGSQLDAASISLLLSWLEQGFLPFLESLDLYWCDLEEESAVNLYKFMCLHPYIIIQASELIQFKMEREMYAVISQYVVTHPDPSIRVIDIRDTSIDDNVLVLLADMISHESYPNLNSIFLNNNAMISTAGIWTLSNVLSSRSIMKSLHSFSCADNHLSDLAPAISNLFRNNRKLQRLWLNSTSLSDEGLRVIVDSLIENECTSLKLVNMKDNMLTAAGMSELARLVEKGIWQITELGLSNNSVGDEGLIVFLEAMRGKKVNIEKLYIREIGITEEGMRVLGETIGAGDLVVSELGLSDNKIGMPGLRYLIDGVLRSNCRLSKLWLYETGIGTEGVRAYAELMFSGLMDNMLLLDIAGNGFIVDPNVRVDITNILTIHRQFPLQELWLGGCISGEDGTYLVTNLIRNHFFPNLHTLTIDKCELNDSLGEDFMNVIISEYEHMKRFNCSDNFFSEPMKQRIRMELSGIVENLII